MLIRLDWVGSNSRLGTLLREAFALEQLVAIHCVSSDLRWALAELAVRSIAAMLAAGSKRLACWGRRLAQRLRFAAGYQPC
jgi:hypothetical protein